MRRPHVPIFALALGGSLLAHLIAFSGTRLVRVSGFVAGERQGSRTSMVVSLLTTPVGEGRDDEVKQADVPPDLTPPLPPEVVPPPEPKPAPVPPPEPKPEMDRHPDEIGKKDGTGITSHEAKGEKPMIARPGDTDQPFVRRSPQIPGVASDRSPSKMPAGDGGAGGKSTPEAQAPPAQAAPPPIPPAPRRLENVEIGELRPGPIKVDIPVSARGLETGAKQFSPVARETGPLAARTLGSATPIKSAGAAPSLPDPFGILPPPATARREMSPPPAPLLMRMPLAAEPTLPALRFDTRAQPTPRVIAIADASPGAPGRPGAPAAASPAQQSESEVDPFSKIGTWELRRDGSAAPQFGREVKTIRPKIGIPGQIDAAFGARSVTLRVRIAPDGHVTNAEVSASSGSNDVDTPCLVAMYEWWFEPLKDKQGSAITDTIYFTINFR